MATRAMDSSARGVGTMLGAKRIGGAQTHALQGLFQVPAERQRFAETDESSKRSFAIRRGRVQEDAGHRAAAFA